MLRQVCTGIREHYLVVFFDEAKELQIIYFADDSIILPFDGHKSLVKKHIKYNLSMAGRLLDISPI